MVVVHGIPAPQGSKRAFSRGGHAVVVDDNKATLRTWREDVKLATLRELGAASSWASRLHPAVSLYATFCLPRPMSHYQVSGGTTSHRLKPWAPSRHTGKPDLDKLLRSTMDALTAAGAYVDDAKVCAIFAQKVYVSNDETSIPGVMPDPGARLVLMGVNR